MQHFPQVGSYPAKADRIFIRIYQRCIFGQESWDTHFGPGLNSP